MYPSALPLWKMSWSTARTLPSWQQVWCNAALQLCQSWKLLVSTCADGATNCPQIDLWCGVPCSCTVVGRCLFSSGRISWQSCSSSDGETSSCWEFAVVLVSTGCWLGPCLRSWKLSYCSCLIFLRLDNSTTNNMAQVDTFGIPKLTLPGHRSQSRLAESFQNHWDASQVLLPWLTKNNQVI